MDRSDARSVCCGGPGFAAAELIAIGLDPGPGRIVTRLRHSRAPESARDGREQSRPFFQNVLLESSHAAIAARIAQRGLFSAVAIASSLKPILFQRQTSRSSLGKRRQRAASSRKLLLFRRWFSFVIYTLPQTLVLDWRDGRCVVALDLVCTGGCTMRAQRSGVLSRL